MNKFKISTLLLFMAFALCSVHGQGRKTRFCDIKVEIDRFNEGDTFYTPGLIYTRMFIINKGPDTVYKGDMLHIEYKFGGYYYNPSFPPCGKKLGVGDSLLFERRFSPNGYLNVFDGIFCSFAKLAQIYNGDSLIYENNLQLKDNWSCMRANHIALLSTEKTTSVNAQVFPNPCRDGFFIPKDQLKTMVVYTMDGKTIPIKAGGMEAVSHDGFVKIATNGWKPGLYLVKSQNINTKILVLAP